MTIAPRYAPLVIYQGASFVEEFHWHTQESDGAPLIPVNLTGYTARMQVRETVDAPEPLLEFTPENNRIVITPEKGLVTIRLRPMTTAALGFEQAVYDLEVEAASGEVYRLAHGPVTLDREVTR